jgi:cation diffusion facilitator CzcD-associated flavoprotein CzcO
MTESTDRICIIGAGPGGLSAAAALQLRDVPFEIIDAGERPGGIWDIDRRETPMYESAHFISSKSLSGLSDFPMPAEFPDYPRHDQILRYVQEFARVHDLERHIQLRTRVTAARPLSDGSNWQVTLDSGEERRYQGLCVATGATWHPRLPEIGGRFDGEQRHAFHYRSPELFRGKRVLVVGGGNSGCDIACDAARVADRALISVRRGYHFVPKYVFGMPADQFAHQGPRLPGWLEQRVFGLILRILVGNPVRYGLPRPDHRVLESHPIMNTEVLHHLGHGRLEAVPDVRELRPGGVVLEDGREEAVDLILWATGYERVFPFLHGQDLAAVGGVLDPYLNVFHRRHRTLCFMGLFETDGAAYPLFGLQADLIAAYLSGLRNGLPSVARFDQLRSDHHPDLKGGRRYLKSRRHDYYVKGDAYERVLLDVKTRMNWE